MNMDKQPTAHHKAGRPRFYDDALEAREVMLRPSDWRLLEQMNPISSSAALRALIDEAKKKSA